MKISTTKTKKGFTLIEIMVSLTIFTVVVVIAIGAFLRIIAANKQSQSLQTAMNNANFALESMTRELRVGSNYVCFDATNVGLIASFSASGSHNPIPCGMGSYDFPGIAFYSSIPVNPTDLCNGQKYLIHAYRLSPGLPDPNVGTIEKAEQQRCTDVLNDSSFAPLTSADLVITKLGIQVDSSATTQPRVFILLNGYTGTGPNARDTANFVVQTTASQRSMN